MKNPATLKVRKIPFVVTKGFSFIGPTARCFYISKGVRRSPLQSNQCYQMYSFTSFYIAKGEE